MGGGGGLAEGYKWWRCVSGGLWVVAVGWRRVISGGGELAEGYGYWRLVGGGL
jgi:hypothetical protein